MLLPLETFGMALGTNLRNTAHYNCHCWHNVFRTG